MACRCHGRSVGTFFGTPGCRPAKLIEPVSLPEHGSGQQLRELADSQWADLALTEGKLAQMLEPFGVGPGRFWSAEKRTPQSKRGRGYLRVWFEEAWRRYLDDEEQEHEPSKSAKILHLRGD
jgi:hypothetical protein